MKCTGEPSGCGRCAKQGLLCHYSFQKQMGRRPKARVDIAGACTEPEQNEVVELESTTTSAPDPLGTLEASNLCPSIYKSFMKNTYDLRPGPFMTSGPIFEHQESWQQQGGQQSAWKPPDIDFAQMAPMPSSSPSGMDMGFDSDMSGLQPQQPLTPCSCLSYLYLSLSSLSTLFYFPLSSSTLTTLYTTAHTALSVLGCEICPQSFGSGVQNFMLLGTLFNVMADAWLRILQMDGESLCKEIASASYIATIPQEPESWKSYYELWLKQLVQHAIVGGSEPCVNDLVQTQCLKSPSLMSLIEKIEERQYRWHKSRTMDSGTSHQIVDPKTQRVRKCESGDEPDYFCVRVAGSARTIIERFPFEVGDSSKSDVTS